MSSASRKRLRKFAPCHPRTKHRTLPTVGTGVLDGPYPTGGYKLRPNPPKTADCQSVRAGASTARNDGITQRLERIAEGVDPYHDGKNSDPRALTAPVPTRT